jgi:uroporphyrinogen-III synthase
VLLYSAKAAGIVRELAHRPALAHLFRDATFLCLSQRVANAFPAVGGERIRVSPEPNEEALLSLLPA